MKVHDDWSIQGPILFGADAGVDIGRGFRPRNAISVMDVPEDVEPWLNGRKADFQFLATDVFPTVHLISHPVWRAMGDQDISANWDLIPDFPKPCPLSG
jgi:hypothetical protein